MFDDNNKDFDLMMKSILENGQETVPERVWDNVSSSLDKIARRKKAFVIFKRSIISSAIAAGLALGLFFGFNDVSTPIQNPDNSSLIAVIPNSESSEDNVNDSGNLFKSPKRDLQTPNHQSIAQYDKVPHIDKIENVATSVDDFIRQTDSYEEVVTAPKMISQDAATETKPFKEEVTRSEHPKTETIAKETEDTYLDGFDDIWEDEKPKNKIRTSIDFSGLASTNNSKNGKKGHIMKRPTRPNSPEKTGVTDNSTKSTFGIPVSFGAAVKVEFTPRWAISVGARYTLLTRKFYGTYTKINEDGMVDWTESSDIRNSQHFVGVPVNAYFNIVNRDFLKFYVRAGGAFEKCVMDKYQVLSSQITHTEKVAGLQWSVEAGVGIEFAVAKHLGIYIDPSLRYYFPNGNQPKSLRTIKPLMLGFEAGLRVNF